jgi:ubiquinone/menaquinone biosynthesis C-methylase UbiE
MSISVTDDAEWSCVKCGRKYPVIDGIPSLVAEVHNERCQSRYDKEAASGDYSAQAVGYLSGKNQRTIQTLAYSMSGPLQGDSRILDVGCGHGSFSSSWAKTNRVVGVDISLPMLELAKRIGIEPYHADATSLPFSDGQFDLAVGIGVIEYITDPSLLLSELSRVIKPDGRIIISWPNAASIARKINRAVIRPIFRTGPSTHDLPILRSWKSVYEAGRELGLAVETIGLTFFPFTVTLLRSALGFLDCVMASNFVVKLRRAHDVTLEAHHGFEGCSRRIV